MSKFFNCHCLTLPLIISQVLYTSIYVLPLYISSSSRPSPTLSRDDPRVIRTRVTSVLFSTVICCTITYIVLAQLPDGVLPISPLHAMGYWPVGLAESGSALLLTSILFAGPLYEALLIDGLWEDWKSLEPLTHVWTRWTTWRNIVMVCHLNFLYPFLQLHTHLDHRDL